MSADTVACPRCGALFGADEPQPLLDETAVIPSAAPRAVETTSSVTVARPVTVAPPAAPPPPRRRRRVRGYIGMGLGAGILVALVLLALEAVTVGPGLTPPSKVRLVEREFPAVRFKVSVPTDWSSQQGATAGRPSVTFASAAQTADGEPRHQLNVVAGSASFDRILRELRKRRSELDPEGLTVGLRVGGRRAARHIALDEDGRFERWWIARNRGAFRLEFHAAPADADDAVALDERIVQTFREL